MSQRKFTVLGTASQVPTRDRNHNGYFLKWDSEGFLFDPGEGTQRQLTSAGISCSKITKIFITHFHGDHCLGLPGVLQRLSLDKVKHKVKIFYPASGQKFLNNLKNASIYRNNIEIEENPIDKGGEIFSNSKIVITAKKLSHSAESFGYRIEEKSYFSMDSVKISKGGI